MAGLNLMTGTFSYMYHIVTLRKTIHMSAITTMLQIFLAAVHMVLWFGAIAIYLGYVEELELEEEIISKTKDGYYIEIKKSDK